MIDSGVLSKGHGKVLLTEPDHARRRILAQRSAENEWSVRTLEAEITRASKATKPRQSPHPDQCAAATRLEAAISNATGCDVQATPHRHGLRIILDQTAAERLARTLDGDRAAR